MDKIFFNGCIRTLDDQNTVAQAVGIENGKITFIGTGQEAERIFCEDRTDLQGRLLLPGFVDTHLHMLHYAFVEKSVKLFDCRSVEEMLDTAKKIGLTMTESYMLTPTKSVTAVIGISDTQEKCHIKGCEACGKKDCIYRRN